MNGLGEARGHGLVVDAEVVGLSEIEGRRPVLEAIDIEQTPDHGLAGRLKERCGRRVLSRRDWYRWHLPSPSEGRMLAAARGTWTRGPDPGRRGCAESLANPTRR